MTARIVCPNGHAAFGHYTITDNVLTMTDDNHQTIAAVLTRELRTALRGGAINGFDGPIDYSHQRARWR